MEALNQTTCFKRPQRNTHQNASLTLKGRTHLLSQIAVLGLAAIAQAAGISCRTARKWQRCFFAEGQAGLLDRSSRPHHCPRRFARLLQRLKIKQLRTKPYTPRTNGKAERFIQTALREWACAYRYPSSAHCADELAP